MSRVDLDLISCVDDDDMHRAEAQKATAENDVDLLLIKK